MKKKCLYCGKEFYVKPCRFDRTKFHNKKCQLAYIKENPMSDEWKHNISKAKGGIKRDTRVCKECGTTFEVESWRKNLFCGRKCAMRNTGKQSRIPWNKGLTIKNSDILKTSGSKISNTLSHKHADGTLNVWNKGLTSETDERMKKLTEHLTQLRNTEGVWKEQWRDAMRRGQVKAWAEGVYDRPITAPEQLTWDHLVSKGCNVKWFKDASEDDPANTWYFQFPFHNAFVPDFACPDLKCVIEVHGCAIHGHNLDKCKLKTAKYGWTDFAVNNSKRDRKKYWLYHNKDWKWAIVWQCEVNDNDFHRLETYLDLKS